ncbi:MAG: HIRAN domain-containing protein [Limimaricola soesokkakensis]|uniref:HIRAN domain-containing protein n=1 Tax=Limimaricola soesokkakensis TaxID=1343159 RepID=UPI0040599013
MLTILRRIFTRKPVPKVLYCRRSKGLMNYVVGEAFHQPVFAELAGPKTEDGYDLDCQVIFEAEPTNQMDRKAVKASISGQHIGYLPRHMADDFHAAMRANGTASAIADGKISGGWHRPEDDEEGAFGVKVFMKWPPVGEVR